MLKSLLALCDIDKNQVLTVSISHKSGRYIFSNLHVHWVLNLGACFGCSTPDCEAGVHGQTN